MEGKDKDKEGKSKKPEKENIRRQTQSQPKKKRLSQAQEHFPRETPEEDESLTEVAIDSNLPSPKRSRTSASQECDSINTATREAISGMLFGDN